MEAEVEAEAVNMKWMEAEAEAEAVKKILEAEAIKIYRFHRFHYSGIWGKISLFLWKFSELKPDFKPCWTSVKWKWKRKRKQQEWGIFDATGP